MKKELFKLKLNRLIIGIVGATLQFWYAITVLSIIACWAAATWWINLIIIFIGLLLHKIIKDPMERLHSLFFGSKLEDLDLQIKKILASITDRKIERANEREDVFNSKIDIIAELKSLRYNIPNIQTAKAIIRKLNNIHLDEIKKPTIIDVENIGIKKKDFKDIRKKAIKLVKKVKVSKINAVKLKEIEDILTGEDKRKQEEHQKQLELAQAGAQQNVVMVQAPVQVPAAPQNQLTFEQAPQVIEMQEANNEQNKN